MKRAAVLAALIAAGALTACAGDPEPKIVQSTSTDQEIRLSVGIATQIELPKGERVLNVTVGNPDLVVANSSGDVVGLAAKGEGETNILVRVSTAAGEAKVHKYRLIVSR